MLKKIVHIIIGWAKRYNILETTEAEQKLSDLRLEQCSKCPLSRQSKVLEIIGEEANYVEKLYCTICTCPCAQKSLVVEESCPKNNW